MMSLAPCTTTDEYRAAIMSIAKELKINLPELGIETKD
jgi:hypothetical protein